LSRTGALKGPAFACIYKWKGHGILVAHYLTADGGLDIGSVNLDEDFSYIEPARYRYASHVPFYSGW